MKPKRSCVCNATLVQSISQRQALLVADSDKPANTYTTSVRLTLHILRGGPAYLLSTAITSASLPSLLSHHAHTLMHSYHCHRFTHTTEPFKPTEPPYLSCTHSKSHTPNRNALDCAANMLPTAPGFSVLTNSPRHAPNRPAQRRPSCTQYYNRL